MADEQKQPTASQEEIADVRQKMDALAERAKNDPGFIAQMKAEPAATLKGAGLPDPAIAEVLSAWKVEPEVEGHYLYDVCYAYTSYYITYCTYFTG